MAYQKILIKDAEGNLIAGSPTFDENNQAVVTIGYESDEANLSGVGISFDFDASGLSVVGIADVFAGAIASGEQSGDGDAQWRLSKAYENGELTLAIDLWAARNRYQDAAEGGDASRAGNDITRLQRPEGC